MNMKDFTISIPESVCAALFAKLLEFKTEQPGPNPGETIVRPVFPDVETWLRQIIGQNIAQLVPPTAADPEVAQLEAAIENLKRQHAEKSNCVTVASAKQQ
jgi:hypothetical protein